MTEIATPATKETKAQRIEPLKRANNPWEIFDEVRAFAREGRSSVVPEWAGAYFKWWGIYTQGDGVGAVGGKGGEGLASDYFMMRIGMPNGIVTSSQLRVIADITRTHARNLADITTRQNIQLHWLTIESIPEVVDALDDIGLSPKGACGDVVRNVTGCPLAGIAHDEIVDASPLAQELAHALVANPEFYNLPRKFKMSATGCPVWCSYPEINDVAFTAIRRGDEVGYTVRVGGGLSSDPHLAVRLNAFIPRGEVVDVARTVTRIFRDQQGLRENRDRARMKHLFTREGWTPERFLGEIERRIGYSFDPVPRETAPEDVLRDHVGIHPQKQAGHFYVGAAVLRGRISAQQMRTAADLAQRFADGHLRTTNMQNLLIANVPWANTEALAEELNAAGLPVQGSSFWRGTVACSGSEYCKLAITETKSFSRWLVEELEERLPGFEEHLKLHVTGCPNSCGQHWIADIGIEGKKIKVGDRMEDAYYFCVGGAVGLHQSIARPVGYRCLATEVPDAIERLLRRYLDDRRDNENLRQFFARHTDIELREFLAGEWVPAVLRDASAGKIPHGIEG
jgi:sulfite reductase (ferredoxin)